MGLKSEIEWTDASWNPWQGCTKVSPACTNCYMFTDLKRYGRDGSIVVRSKPPTFNLPLKKRQTGEYAIPSGSKVFTCSWSDWFHVKADPWRAEAWEIIRKRPDVTFQIVTKRTERIAECLPIDWGRGWPNVWLIATAEDQEWADVRIPQLLSVPAVVHGLSCEPLLGPIDLTKLQARFFDAFNHIKWIIAGGESGHHPRPTHPNWVRSLRDQCVDAGVAFHFKQWGEFRPYDNRIDPLSNAADGSLPERVSRLRLDGSDITNTQLAWNRGDEFVIRVGKKAAGRLLDGRTWEEFPEVAVANV